MAYKVIITTPAQRKLDNYVFYTLSTLKNEDAARAILEDAEKTKKILANMANINAFCNDEVLRKHGYRKQHFQKHRYLMIYRICDDMAVVEGMYHELQDYESIFTRERNI